MKLSPTSAESTLTEHYRLAFGIRSFERMLLDQFAAGRLNGTTHSCIGQEVAQVGITAALDRERDCMFSNHRCHGHFLAYCGEVRLLLAEIMGRDEGLCGGRGGSQHIFHRNFYTNGLQGGIVGNAAGIALAEKHKKSGAIAVVWVGDGTFGEGLVYETLNMAALWRLPLVVVAECNGIAQTTPTSAHMIGDVASRFAAFGIPTTEIAGNDINEALTTAQSVFNHTREDHRPRGIISRATRLGPHSKGDDTRASGFLEAAWKNDPLALLRSRIASTEAATMEAEIHQLITECVASMDGDE